jgi:hypothetical protein
LRIAKNIYKLNFLKMKKNITQIKTLFCLLLLLGTKLCLAQSGSAVAPGNHVFSGAEASNFGVVDLATPGGQTWSTDRQAIPGYFSAIGTASYTGAADGSNINGYVKHYANIANQGFTFPVGNGLDFRSLTISGTRDASSIVATAWIVGDPSTTNDPTAPNAGNHAITAMGAGIVAVSNVGQWDWLDIANNAGGLTVTVSIPDVSAFGVAGALRLVGWNGTQWVNLSGNTGASGNTENSTLSGTMVSGISAIAIGLAGSPDLTPTADIDDLNFAAASVGRDMVVNVFEINNAAHISGNSIVIKIRKVNGFDITYSTANGTSNVLGGVANSNGDWTFTEDATFITITAKAGTTIPANGVKRIGLTVTRKVGVPINTTQNITTTIVFGSSGETVTNNNIVETAVTAN